MAYTVTYEQGNETPVLIRKNVRTLELAQAAVIEHFGVFLFKALMTTERLKAEMTGGAEFTRVTTEDGLGRHHQWIITELGRRDH
jgi:hypothetical protein